MADPGAPLTWVEIVDNAIKAGLLTVLGAGGKALLRRADRAGPAFAALAREWLADRREERDERKAERLERRVDREAATGGAVAVERIAAALHETAARLEIAMAQGPTADLPMTRSTSVPPPTSQIIAPSARAQERRR